MFLNIKFLFIWSLLSFILFFSLSYKIVKDDKVLVIMKTCDFMCEDMLLNSNMDYSNCVYWCFKSNGKEIK